MAFNATTEQWRDLVAANAGGIPTDYLLAWIQRESNGSPCSWTKLREAGIFQLEPPDNIAQGGTTIDAIHPVGPCSPEVQTSKWFGDLTSDQAYEQVRSGIQYVNYARSRIHQLLTQYNGGDWDENTIDFWTLVKMYHNLPGPLPTGMKAAQAALGRPANSWAELRPYVNAPAKWLDYAEWIGAYAAGGPDPLLDFKNTLIDTYDPITTPPGTPLSWIEIGLIATAAIAGVYAALRFDRWIGHSKSV